MTSVKATMRKIGLLIFLHLVTLFTASAQVNSTTTLSLAPECHLVRPFNFEPPLSHSVSSQLEQQYIIKSKLNMKCFVIFYEHNCKQSKATLSNN